MMKMPIAGMPTDASTPPRPTTVHTRGARLRYVGVLDSYRTRTHQARASTSPRS